MILIINHGLIMVYFHPKSVIVFLSVMLDGRPGNPSNLTDVGRRLKQKYQKSKTPHLGWPSFAFFFSRLKMVP